MRKGLFLFTLMVVTTMSAYSEQVTPSDAVKNFVNVWRTSSGSSSGSVGRLHPGEKVPLIAEVTNYYKVKLTDGTEGFVRKSFADLIPDAPPPSMANLRVHFLDVGTGDSSIIDMGPTEIIIDGGDSLNVLKDYVNTTPGLLDGPVELVIVTHGDSDHWKGLNRLLNFDGGNPNPPNVLEFWEPGYNRDCGPLQSYDDFISNVESIPGILLRRPLENTHAPAVDAGLPQPLNLPSLPGVTITVLHSDSTPQTSNGECSYRINNASIVLKLEVGEHSFLFTGDANGKERSDDGSLPPGHIEGKLLALEQQHPGTLAADVLKVPHHGSETSSTQAFIDAVNPQFAIISASTKHHLPKDDVVDRYADELRVILRTDEDRKSGIDHIVCYVTSDNLLDCNFADVLNQ